MDVRALSAVGGGDGIGLAAGAIGASTVLLPRVVIAAAFCPPARLTGLRARADLTLPRAACAIAVGIAANAAFKLTLALVFGRGVFRTRVAVALAGMAAATL